MFSEKTNLNIISKLINPFLFIIIIKHIINRSKLLLLLLVKSYILVLIEVRIQVKLVI